MTFIEKTIYNLLATRRLPYPRAISIEPVGGICQLRCPLCPTGLQGPSPNAKIMALETFKTLLAKIPFVKIVELYRSGEPFLNPDLFGMIRHASGRGIKVIVSTHFSFAKPDDFYEEVVTCGLERLVISLDGTSQQSYEKYRVGGNYELVMASLKRVLETRDKLQKTTPEIVWQFLVNRYNEHEIDTARQIAERLKIKLDIRPMDLDDELPDVELADSLEQRRARWLPLADRYQADRYRGEYQYPLYPGMCTDLFTRMVVTAHGQVMPCCLTWDPANAFGNLLIESFDDIWYGRNYLAARARFLDKNYAPEIHPVCYRCKNFGGTPALRDKLSLLLDVYRKSFGHWGS